MTSKSRARLVAFEASRSPDAGVRGPVVLPFPAPLAPLTQVKSTLLLASVDALRASGHFASYREFLDPDVEDAVIGSLAGSWLPLSAARAHYNACDALNLPASEQMSIGDRTGSGLKQHLTRVAGAVSREVGVTPWWIFEHFNRFWARTFDGGGVSVVRLGPKEAEVTYAQCSLLESPYFRNALRGVAVGLLGTVTRRGFMSALPALARGDEVRYRFSWV